MGDLLAFVGDAHFVAELLLGAADAQLGSHAGEEFLRVPGAGDGIIREEVEGGRAVFGAWADKEDDAKALCGRCAEDGREEFASSRVAQACVENQDIGGGLVDGVERFATGGIRGDFIAGFLQSGT